MARFTCVDYIHYMVTMTLVPPRIFLLVSMHVHLLMRTILNSQAHTLDISLGKLPLLWTSKWDFTAREMGSAVVNK